ncbi:hypothetical protein KY343_01250 [Candidatus Woesearchaeota archaeon]|nr:hypothetical protein [Candidatus Woesearchaeota archaeon]
MESKKNRKKLLIAIGIVIAVFVLFIVAFRVTLYLRGPTSNVVTIDELHKLNLEGKLEEDSYVYNGFSFVYFNDGWYTQVQRGNTIYDVPLHYGPRDVEDIPVTGKLGQSFGQGRVIYISFYPEDYYLGFAAIELSLNLGKGMNAITKSACDKDYDIDACKERGVVTCEDTDKSVILIKQSNETKIRLSDKCVIIEGNEKELLRATDNVILHFYGIMD